MFRVVIVEAGTNLIFDLGRVEIANLRAEHFDEFVHERVETNVGDNGGQVVHTKHRRR